MDRIVRTGFFECKKRFTLNGYLVDASSSFFRIFDSDLSENIGFCC